MSSIEIKNRKVYLDWIRIIAVALVIFNHSAGYTLYQVSEGGKQFFYMFLTMLTRINVPLFFMVSGALLFGHQDDFKEIFRKKIVRFIFITVIFQGLLYICYCAKGMFEEMNPGAVFRRWVFGVLAGDLEGTTQYWYLYAYVGMLFMLPFLQRMACGMRNQDFILLISLRFVFYSFIPIVNVLLGMYDSELSIKINSQFSVPLAALNAFFYPLIGYYIDDKIDINKLKNKHVFIAVLISVVGIVLSCACTYYEGIVTGIYTQNYVNLFDYITAIAAFIFIKWMTTVVCPKLSKGKLAKAVCYCSSLTFGIYLLGPFLSIIGGRVTTTLEPLLPTLLVSGCWVLFSLLVGGIITSILRKMPILKNIL